MASLPLGPRHQLPPQPQSQPQVQLVQQPQPENDRLNLNSHLASAMDTDKVLFLSLFLSLCLSSFVYDSRFFCWCFVCAWSSLRSSFLAMLGAIYGDLVVTFLHWKVGWVAGSSLRQLLICLRLWLEMVFFFFLAY